MDGTSIYIFSLGYGVLRNVDCLVVGSRPRDAIDCSFLGNNWGKGGGVERFTQQLKRNHLPITGGASPLYNGTTPNRKWAGFVGFNGRIVCVNGSIALAAFIVTKTLSKVTGEHSIPGVSRVGIWDEINAIIRAKRTQEQNCYEDPRLS